MAITRHGFLQVNGNNCLISLSALVPTYYYVPFTTSLFYWLLGLFVALFIGVATGTYSSIFVASPIVVLWHNWRTKKA
jgi:preprotein translocase subunit SecF